AELRVADAHAADIIEERAVGRLAGSADAAIANAGLRAWILVDAGRAVVAGHLDAGVGVDVARTQMTAICGGAELERPGAFAFLTEVVLRAALAVVAGDAVARRDLLALAVDARA